MPLDLETVTGAIAILKATGQAVSAQQVWLYLHKTGQGGRRTRVQQLFRQARTAPDIPRAPAEEEEPVDEARQALAAKIAALQAELKALDEAALPPLWEMPGWEPMPELASFQRHYQTAMAATPTDIYNDRVVIERAAVQFDFNQKVQMVRRLLTRARGLARRPPPLPGQNIDSDDARVLQADMAVIARFCGKVEAQRLLQSDAVPRWTLEG